MNLHGIAGPIVGAVNPRIPVSVRVSTGVESRAPDGTPTPGYATPGAVTASIAGAVLTASVVSAGSLMAGQALADLTAALLPGTRITGQITGPTGGPGTYAVSREQTVPSEAMTTSLPLLGQVQPLTAGDLRQLDGVNLGGVRWKIFLDGVIDAVVRPERRGGDLVTISTGPHQGVWLVVLILEQWPDWCVAAIVQQNGS